MDAGAGRASCGHGSIIFLTRGRVAILESSQARWLPSPPWLSIREEVPISMEPDGPERTLPWSML